MPANQSSPSAWNGASPAAQTAPRTRSGRSAAHAKGVRAPTGMAHDRELLDAQRIGDAGDVSGH